MPFDYTKKIRMEHFFSLYRNRLCKRRGKSYPEFFYFLFLFFLGLFEGLKFIINNSQIIRIFF
jgi:hypothetical protein